jgi:hypothetical protein
MMSGMKLPVLPDEYSSKIPSLGKWEDHPGLLAILSRRGPKNVCKRVPASFEATAGGHMDTWVLTN